MSKISPLDIRNQTFRTVFRGADNEEVRVFLDLVATEYENVLQENVQLMERLRHAEDRLLDYRNLEQTLRDGVLTAERLAAEARESSKRESNLVIQDAELRAERILEDARVRLSKLAEEIRELAVKKDIYLEQMRTFLVSHMEMLERNERYLEGVDAVGEEAHAMVSRMRRPDARPAPPPPAQRAPAAPVETTAPAPERRSAAPPPSPSGPPPRGAYGQITREQLARERAETRGERPASYAPPEPDGMLPAGDGPERSEGLFEISADEEEPPRTR